MFKLKKGESAIEHYYMQYLSKETLTDKEFNMIVIDWLLGMNFYIADSVSGPQGNRIILDEIMKKFPKSKSENNNDKEWIYRTNFAELPKKEDKE